MSQAQRKPGSPAKGSKAKPRAGNKFPSLKLSAITGLERLRQSGQRILKEILNSHKGHLGCILDPELTWLLNLVTEGPQIFKDNGVKYFDELKSDMKMQQKIEAKKRKNVHIDTIVCLLKPTVRNTWL